MAAGLTTVFFVCISNSTIVPAPKPTYVSCKNADAELTRREKQIAKELTRLRNGIRHIKETRGAFTPGGKRRLYRLEHRQRELTDSRKQLRKARAKLVSVGQAKRAGAACRVPQALLPAKDKAVRAPAKRSAARADVRAMATARAKQALQARARLKEIASEITRVETVLEKYRKRKVLHRRFRRRIRNYGALIKQLEAERSDLHKKLIRLGAKKGAGG